MFFLHKCKLVSSSLCDFCQMEIETVSHMFWECMYVQTFWMKLKDCLNENQITVNITFKTTTFGIQESFTNENKLKNVMILLAKYFIFKNITGPVKYRRRNNNRFPRDRK